MWTKFKLKTGFQKDYQIWQQKMLNENLKDKLLLDLTDLLSGPACKIYENLGKKPKYLYINPIDFMSVPEKIILNLITGPVEILYKPSCPKGSLYLTLEKLYNV